MPAEIKHLIHIRLRGKKELFFFLENKDTSHCLNQLICIFVFSIIKKITYILNKDIWVWKTTNC